MSLITVRLEDVDNADLPVSFQLMAAVPRRGDCLWLGSPPYEYEVISVSWRLREQRSTRNADTEVDLMVRRIGERDADTVSRDGA